MRASSGAVGLVVLLIAVTAFGGVALLPFATGQPALAPRKPWTTSRVVGSPEPPPPYRTVRVFRNVTLENPLLIRCAPGTDRLFVGEHEGRLYSIANRPDATAEPFLDLVNDLRTVKLHPGAGWVDAVLGLEFHPKFAENRYCFVLYTLSATVPKNLPDGTRLSRFRVTNTDPPRAIPESEEIILTWLQGGHNAGDIHFGPDGYLYISTGDGADPSPPDQLKTGQDISDLLSSILRIDVDHKDPGRNYAVPKDNPFVDHKGARGEVWAYGFRNPWRMSFDRQTGDLWVGDVGWELWEMVHRVEKGGNYGWSIVEARQPVNTDLPPGPTPIRPPVIELPHTVAASVIGGYVYRGKKLPELTGAYIFGDWETRRLWAARVNGDRLVSLTEIAEPSLRVSAFGEDNAGEIYIVDYDDGTIHTLARNDAPARQPADFPRTLSATGLFASTKDHRPAEGVLPFEITAARWADHATAERLVALPSRSPIVWHPTDVEIPGSQFERRFEFPADAVLAETLSLEMEQGNPASRKRIETQLLHFDGFRWRGYSYAWNDAGTDAELVPADGAERVLTIDDRNHPGGRRTQTWAYPGRAQCFVCHNPWAQTTLAFNIAQLNRDTTLHGPRINQLAALEAIGVFRRVRWNDEPSPPLDADTIAGLVRLDDPTDPRADLTARARSYLNANCGHCHRYGGGGAVELELHAFLSLPLTKTVDVVPRQGSFDIPDARIIAPGDPGRSVLYLRQSKFGRGRMPHLGSELPDEFGLSFIHDWIRQMAMTNGATAVDAAIGALPADEIDRRLSSTPTALGLARAVGRNQLPAAARDLVLSHAAKLAPGMVRDFFDGYLPHTGERKLGPVPRPATILARQGDPDRGGALFRAPTMQCLNCHRMGNEGTILGPELTTIGKDRTREDLFDSLLDPSRRIEPPYIQYQVSTKDGRRLTGLLVKKDASEVVLRDAQNKEIRLPAELVDQLSPSRLSLMPEGLLRDLTAQQAADLLDFLATRR